MATSTQWQLDCPVVPPLSSLNCPSDVNLAEAIRRGVYQNFDRIIGRLRADEVLRFLAGTDVFPSSESSGEILTIRFEPTELERGRALLKAVFRKGDGALLAFLQAARKVHGDDEEDISKLLIAELGNTDVNNTVSWPGSCHSQQAVVELLYNTLAQLYKHSLRLSCDYGYLPENALSEYYVDTDILEVKKEEALRIMGMDQKDGTRGRRTWANVTRKTVHLRDLQLGEGMKSGLVIGVPGAGKSRLCLELCQQWARGEMLKNIRFPFLLPARELDRVLTTCRFSETDANWLGFLCLSELGLGGLSKEEQTVAWEYLRSHSEEVIILLDGLDELDTDLLDNPNSYLYQIVHRRVLPSCSVLVTSRPCKKALDLVRWTDKHYQIKGMSTEQLRGMMTKWLGEEGACELEKQLAERPQVKNAVSIPLVATMVLGIFLEDEELPSSLGECYELIVMGFLRRYAERNFTDKLGAAPELHSLDECPACIRGALTGLEDLALDLFLGHALVFPISLLEKVCGFPALDSGLLVESRKRSYRDGYNNNCEFIHSTFQEYLAARAVVRSMDHARVPGPIQTCLTAVGTDLNTHTFWLFLAGMLHVKHLVKLLQALHLSAVNGSFLQRKHVTVLILHCLAQRTSEMIDNWELSVTNILSSESKLLDLSNYQLSDSDFAALTRVLDSSTELKELRLVDCCLHANRCRELVKCRGFRLARALDFGANPLLEGEPLQCLSNGITTAMPSMAVTSLSFRSCSLTEGDASSISRLMNSQKQLTSLNVNSNKFFDAGIKTLSLGLCRCTSLEELYMERCGFSATGAAEVAEIFRGMPSLKTVSVRRNPLGDQGAHLILEGLMSNKCLCNVDLHFTDIDDGLCECLQEFVRKHAGREVDPSNGQLCLSLTGNQLGQETRHKLQETLASCPMACHITISFGYCVIDRDGVHELDSSTVLKGEVLHYGKYSEREISYQGLGELSGEQLSSIVSSLNDVDCLDFGRNGIADDVLNGISSAVAQNSRTLAFDLSFNVITFTGVLSLATALSQCNYTLRYLNFQGNNLMAGTQDGSMPTADASRSLELLVQQCPHLQFLGLAMTGIGDAEVTALCRHLHDSSPLLFLALSHNNITDNGTEQLCRHLVNNKLLRVLLFHKNPITEAGVRCLAELQRMRNAGPLEVISLMNMPSACGLPGLVESTILFCYSMEILDVLDSLSGVEDQ